MFRTIRKGFTMVELLVVIAIIGILAVALISAINPLEQIRKGRDTQKRADASQLLSAFERYSATNGYYPWQKKEAENLAPGAADINLLYSNSATAITGCSLGATNCTPKAIITNLVATSDIKQALADRVTAATGAGTLLTLYFNDEVAGSAPRVCFTPDSTAYTKEAFTRCQQASFTTADFPATAIYGANKACPDYATQALYSTNTFSATSAAMICLP